MRTMTKILVFSVFTLMLNLVTANDRIVPKSIEQYCNSLKGTIKKKAVARTFYNVKCVKDNYEPINLFDYDIDTEPENYVVSYDTWLKIPLQYPKCKILVDSIREMEKVKKMKSRFETMSIDIAELTKDDVSYYVANYFTPPLTKEDKELASKECSKAFCQFLGKSEECQDKSMSHETYLQRIRK